MTFTLPFIQHKRHYFLLQIDASGMITCAIASKKRKSLILQAIQQTPCAEHEIAPMGIANPTKVAHIAQEFLGLHREENIPVICFSSLLNTLASPHQQVLQHLLCLSKISGPVIGLYKGTPLTAEGDTPQTVPFIHSELSNLIDVITTPESKYWQQRLLICIMLTIIPTLSAIGYRMYQSSCLKDLTQQEKQLNNYLNKLKPRVQATKEMEQENQVLHDRIMMIKDLTEEHEIPAHICHAIAQ